MAGNVRDGFLDVLLTGNVNIEEEQLNELVQENKEKIEKVLVLCEKEFPKIDGEDLVWFYFPVTIFITGSGTEEQYARVVKLHEYIYEHTEHRPLQIGLGNMLNARNQKQN